MQKYETVDVSQLLKLEKISTKIAKAELDIMFLNNCKLHNVIPKFLCFNLSGANKTDSRFIWKHLLQKAILSTFEFIHQTLSWDLKYENQSGELKALLPNLANVYKSTYKTTKNTLKKHGILKCLLSNKNIVITRSDKGSGIVILDKTFYE